MGDFATQFGAWGEAAAAAAAQARGQPTVDIDATIFGPICPALRDTAEKAAEFLPIPDPAAQQLWQQAISRTETGAEKCTRGLEQGDSALFESSLRDLLEAAGALSGMAQRITML